MTKYDEEYWTGRYLNNNTGWDAKRVTTPLKTYFDHLTDKDMKILIPGCGNGHEVKYLHDHGFTHVDVVDISSEPLKWLRAKCPFFSNENFIHGDFFELKCSYDLIMEQTFFCSLHPSYRNQYVGKMAELLNKGGKIVGVLFNIFFEHQGPPFGGNKEEYLTYFLPVFDLLVFETCYNSIPPRAGSELFIIGRNKIRQNASR